MTWRPPDLDALAERFRPRDHAPRARGRWRASVRHARLDAPARWLGFGRGCSLRRGLALELVGAVGAPVRAEAAGVVRCVVALSPGGVGLAIDHGEGSGRVWLHLARVRLDAGDEVEVGTPLGVVGASSRERACAPWTPPYVRVQAVEGGEAVATREGADEGRGVDRGSRVEPARFDPAAVGDGIAACRDVRLRESMDAWPTLEERAWALTFWRVAAPELFVRQGRLVATTARVPEGW